MTRVGQTMTLSFLALFVLVGCAAESKPTRLYVLSSLDVSSMLTAKQTKGHPIIGVGPVSLPDYLERPEIVTRPSANTLQIGPLDRWGGKLEENVAAVLSDNLIVLLSTDKIVPYPWRRTDRVDYQIRVFVTRFEQGPDGAVHLHAGFALYGGRRTEKLLHAERVRVRTDIGGTDYEATAKAMSEALADLSRTIAAVVGSVGFKKKYR
jgi:uncharacterized protein